MFRVQWIQSSLDELAAIWMQANSQLRQAIAAAAQRIDVELQHNPFLGSESRGEEFEDRVLFVYPPGVQVEIDLKQRIVWVLNVWRFRLRGE